MSRDVVAITPSSTIHEALDLIVENRVAALPVIDRNDRCVGILSTSDLVDLSRDLDDDLTQLEQSDFVSRGWLIEKLTHSMGQEKVDTIMSDSVATVGLEASLIEAARQMLRNRVHRLPVVDNSDHLAGIISTTDIMEALVDSPPS